MSSKPRLIMVGRPVVHTAASTEPSVRLIVGLTRSPQKRSQRLKHLLYKIIINPKIDQIISFEAM